MRGRVSRRRGGPVASAGKQRDREHDRQHDRQHDIQYDIQYDEHQDAPFDESHDVACQARFLRTRASVQSVRALQ